MSNNTDTIDTIDTIEVKLSNIDITPTEKKNKIKNKTKNQLSKQKLSKIELFKKLGEYDNLTNQTRIVTKDEFVGDYSELFFKRNPPPILIDEVQYAPELFSYIKIICDRERKNGLFW